MACLEYIDFKPWREVLSDGNFVCRPDNMASAIHRLPQVFWASGEGWAEANHWALEKVTESGAHLETAKGLMKHLHAYACFLEAHGFDWRYFPVRLAQRPVVRFRGDLIKQIDRGSLASSTARSRMNAVVQFYRHAAAHGFLSTATPMWRERTITIPYFDAVGFKRSLSRASTDLAIPNRAVHGVRLEDGLLPLSDVHMAELLKFAETSCSSELRLLLATGFFTGARIGTITTLRIENLEQARPDLYMKGFSLVRVGPGTGVATKLNVEGELLFPDALLAAIKDYAYSTDRLKREARAPASERSIVFLTVRGRTYSNGSVSRLMTDLRRNAVRANLIFMKRFRFHQTRATYGTWLMKLTLSVTTVGAAIEFVKNAMLHKHEATTFRYVKFLDDSKGKQEAAKIFYEAFTGLCGRAWGDSNA